MRAALRSSAQVSSSPFAGGTAMTGRAVKWIEHTRAAPTRLARNELHSGGSRVPAVRLLALT
jgi:hypothetical protein